MPPPRPDVTSHAPGICPHVTGGICPDVTGGTFWLGVAAGAASSLAAAGLLWGAWRVTRWLPERTEPAQDGNEESPSRPEWVEGHTRVVCCHLAKAEFLNPGGSMKDRVAKAIIVEAEGDGTLQPGGTICEGTSGSTGVSLALLARARGYECLIAMPDDQAPEKSELLRMFGARVDRVRPVSIIDNNNYCNIAKRKAASVENAIYCDQFENLANYRTHYAATGPEIWRQTGGVLDAFVAAAGTGGTIAGVSKYLKEQDPAVQVFLADPQGSSLYNRVKNGVLYAWEEGEGKKRRHQNDTITEGIGLNRLTANFNEGVMDGAFRVTDREAVEMGHYLLKNDGLFVGSSSALNCVAAVKAARTLGPGHTIVTILCDGGARHLKRFYNREFLRDLELEPQAQGLEFVQPVP